MLPISSLQLTVDLSHQNLLFVPHDISLNVTKLELGHNCIGHLDDQEFSRLAFLEYLSLAHNPLRTVPITAFTGCPIQYLILVNTSITAMPDLCVLSSTLRAISIGMNAIRIINASQLDCFEKIEKFEMNYSPLEFIDFPPNVKRTLQKITLKDKAPVYISETFCNMTMLTRLTLRGGSFARSPVSDYDFWNTALSYLLLERMELLEYPQFKSLGATLEELALIQNPEMESTIQRGTFANLTKLKVLTIQDCNLVNISAFPPLSIEEIILKDNRISSFPPDCFIHLEQLKTLHIEGNHNLSSILNAESLSLNALHLIDNGLKTVDCKKWPHFRNLTILSLRANFIGDVNWLSCMGSPLQDLDLQYNQITVFEIGKWPSWSTLKSINLNGNPLQSPCSWVSKFHSKYAQSLTFCQVQII